MLITLNYPKIANNRKDDSLSNSFVPLETWQFDFSKWRNYSAKLMPHEPLYMTSDIYRDLADLKKLYTALEGIVINIAKEEIICRRKGKQTKRHIQLIENFNQASDGLEQAIFMFKLTHS